MAGRPRLTDNDPLTDLIPADELDVDIEVDEDMPSDEATLLARIPLLAGSNKKMAYLAYRSCGFTPAQACDLADTQMQTLRNWRKSDEVFRNFEENELQRLQETVGNDIIRFEFLRNMRMLLKADFKVIAKGINNLEKMSPREYEIFKALRRFYTPADMLALEKVLHPEKHKDGPVTIKLTWGGRIQGQIEAPDNDMDILEGEVREVS